MSSQSYKQDESPAFRYQYDYTALTRVKTWQTNIVIISWTLTDQELQAYIYLLGL